MSRWYRNEIEPGPNRNQLQWGERQRRSAIAVGLG